MNDVKTVINKIARSIFETVYSPRTKQAIGEFAVRQVKRRTKRGLGVNNKTLEPLKELKSSTVKTRRALKKNGKLSSDTTPDKSNLTQSGNMLNDLQWEDKGRSVEINFKTSKSNEKAENNNDKRQFMDLSKQEEEEVANIVARQIAAALKNIS